MNHRLNKICVNGLTYGYSVAQSVCVQGTVFNKLCVMRLVDFLISVIVRMPVNFLDKPSHEISLTSSTVCFSLSVL